MISKITKPKKNKIRLILLLLLICFSNCKDEPIDGTFTDSDNDGIYDVIDNCPYISNPGQEDMAMTMMMAYWTCMTIVQI